MWGIGGRYAARLKKMGIATAYDFASRSLEWVNAEFNINMQRTWRELNGEDCVPDEVSAPKKSICVSRSFPKLMGDLNTLETYVSNYAARCSEKLRRQNSLAAVVGVFLSTNPFREDLDQYTNFADTRLLTPSNASITIVQRAAECLHKIYKDGFLYKRAGVVVMSMEGCGGVQTNFLDYDAERFEKLKNLDKAIDRINKIEGTETVIIASQQYRTKDSQGKSILFADAIKHDFKSPNYTTRWSDIIELT